MKLNKKFWHRINLPFYSISSNAGNTGNIQISTHACQISMKPKRFECGIYYNTKTLEKVLAGNEFVWQLLADTRYQMANLPGEKSGHHNDKIARFNKRKELSEYNRFDVLKNCLAVIQVKVVRYFNCGDHHRFFCDAVAYKNLNAGSSITLDILCTHKMIIA
jgi:flavin reductase (DIM6/NTAB) family NADH-FMN oxidoreductase RutF